MVQTFKSYYVVWKQNIAQANKSFAKRLNRTMQYGNFIFSYVQIYILLCLNRTMQYGNEKKGNQKKPEVFV